LLQRFCAPTAEAGGPAGPAAPSCRATEAGDREGHRRTRPLLRRHGKAPYSPAASSTHLSAVVCRESVAGHNAMDLECQWAAAMRYSSIRSSTLTLSPARTVPPPTSGARRSSRARRGPSFNAGLLDVGMTAPNLRPKLDIIHRHHEETGEFRSIQVFDFVKHAPDHDTVLKRYETSLDAMATTRRPYTR